MTHSVASYLATALEERRYANLNMREAAGFAERGEWDEYETSVSWANGHRNRARFFLREARRLRNQLGTVQLMSRALSPGRIETVERLGLADPEGQFGDDNLAALNDDGTSFAEIADIIEREPEGLVE